MHPRGSLTVTLTFLAALAAVVLPAPPAAAQDSGFDDVEGVHAEAVAALHEQGITEGCDAGRYCPDEPVRRDQMASFLARALELDTSGAADFADVPADNPHTGAIAAIADAGITEGCEDDRYCPDAAVARQEMASFLTRAFDVPTTDTAWFHDVAGTHADAAQRLGGSGVSAGCDELGLRFCPTGQVERDQMASFIARAMELVARADIALLLEPGDEGPTVAALQEYLTDHDYWVGPIDGVYGTLTEHAVLAVQKVHGLARDGIYGPSTRGALAVPETPRTESGSGYVVEFDEDRQIVMLVQDGVPGLIFHASGGDESYYTYDGTEYWAETPNGSWDIYREVDGWRESHLGRLYRPRYFHTDGIAFHGYTNVPSHAASHGCVRVSIEAMDWIWANDAMPIGTDVLVYGQPS
ncbi:MAG TPA: peptidoglycan-binding protein [Egicoccus sp.]|nr:peptidoglycan-binding protein [Egicoccus sp.]HSK23272.1 peptidoglycan-binding protein [Egicoccus sp.]